MQERKWVTSGMLAAVLVIGLPVSASASTVNSSGVNGNAGVFAAPGEVNHITVVQTGNTRTIVDTAGATTTDPSCMSMPPNQVNCTGPFTASSFTVLAGDLDDTVGVQFPAGFTNLGVSGGAGNDTIDASQSGLLGSGVSLLGAAHLTGGAGNDTVTGSPGNDSLDAYVPTDPSSNPTNDPGDAGDDHLIGGAGDDGLNGERGADVMDGGAGNDLLRASPLYLQPPVFPPPDDGVADDVTCGDSGGSGPAGGFVFVNGDAAEVGPGDAVGADCEYIIEFVACPQGASCAVEATITAPGGAGGSSAAAAAGGKKGKKGKKSKQALLARTRTNVQPGGNRQLNLGIRAKALSKALGNRSAIPATLQFAVTRKKKGKIVGHSKRKVHFHFNG
jgi:Ca2+-binding RTX toxin-like protein